MKVLKFGGSSVGNAERIRTVIDIVAGVQGRNEQVVLVVSAMEGVTNQLVEAGRRAFRGDRSYEGMLDELQARHMEVADELLGNAETTESHLFIRRASTELRDFIHGIWILGELTDRTLDYVMSYGEQLSCMIIAEALRGRRIDAGYLDSRRLICTDLTYGAAQVNFDLTNWNIINHFKNRVGIQVVTGFVACGPENETTTLGRGGSDYTASIIGAALDVDEIEIWTDVDGVMTADPRRVSEAFPQEALTFEEALELSHFGAKVIHPPTMLPALQKRIPIRIRNTFNPSFLGTLISDGNGAPDGVPVKGIACLDRISLLKVKGEGILRTAGIASRIFAALARKEIEVSLVTQSSSERSICLAIASEHARTAREVIELEFRVELHHGQISAISVDADCSVIAVVGEGVRNVPGVTSRIFDALGRNGITPLAIAHGSSERNLTLALRQSDLQKAMNALHDRLFLSRQKTLNLFLLGPGRVGSALLDLLRDQDNYARTALRTRFKVVGIADSRKVHFDARGIDLDSWRGLLAEGVPLDNLARFTAMVREFNAANSIVIDCTGVECAVQEYLSFLGSSISVITSSKVANTLPYDFYRQLRSVAAQHGAQFRYSTTVGAALPIIDSIKSILQNGDSVERIEAILSGSLSLLFSELNTGRTLSEAVRDAKARGYSDTDLRRDLAGTDGAEKLLILIREAGFIMELTDVVITPYVPQSVYGAADFDAALHTVDARIEAERMSAQQHGRALAYIARFENRQARIGVEEIAHEHPFFHLSGDDSIVSLTTRSLYRQPLVVRGGGTGAKLTASGIFNDIVHVSHSMN